MLKYVTELERKAVWISGLKKLILRPTLVAAATAIPMYWLIRFLCREIAMDCHIMPGCRKNGKQLSSSFPWSLLGNVTVSWFIAAITAATLEFVAGWCKTQSNERIITIANIPWNYPPLLIWNCSKALEPAYLKPGSYNLQKVPQPKIPDCWRH